MKKLSIVLAILTLAAMFAMPANAANEILIGTPELDGVLDDLYLDSATLTATTENQVYKSGAEYSDAAEFAATSYYLYDDEYIYICTVVTDATPNHAAKDKVQAGYVWQNDVCEYWISQDGGTTVGQFNFDAAGYGIGVGGAASYASKDVCEGAATMTDDGYIVEVKFPNELKTGETLKTVTQINNGLNADFSKLICIGAQKAGMVDFELSADEAVIEVIEEAPATDSADSAETATATADPITALVALAIAGAGVVVCKKNRK